MRTPNAECRVPNARSRAAIPESAVRGSRKPISSVFVCVHLWLFLFLVAATASAKEVVPSFLGSLTVSNPLTHANLTIFPLTGQSFAGFSFLTLDKAISRGYLEVQEKEDGEVNTVRVQNTSDQYVFGLAGEIITGAKQNRMLERDVLLPPKSGWLDLSVYCVEHGRWHGASMEFGSKGQVAAGRVRAKAAATKSQAEVWDEVGASTAELGVASGSGRFDAVFDDEEVQADIKKYKSALEAEVLKLGPSVLGVAVAVGDRLVCVDVFGANALFTKMWPRLLESYVVDATSRIPSGSLDKKDVSQVLSDAARAKLVLQPTVGSGQLMRIEVDDASGQVLVYNEYVVHLDLFPEEEADSTPLRLDIRRGGVQE